MARRHRDSTTLSQRDFTTRSLATLLTPTRLVLPRPVWLPEPAPVTVPPRRVVLASGPDRRQYRPDRSTRPPAATYPGAARVIASPSVAASVRFTSPPHVAICIRRKARKEVLFAKQRVKQGSRRKRRNRNFWSDVHC